jgi:hypothetical protein
MRILPSEATTVPTTILGVLIVDVSAAGANQALAVVTLRDTAFETSHLPMVGLKTRGIKDIHLRSEEIRLQQGCHAGANIGALRRGRRVTRNPSRMRLITLNTTPVAKAGA